jgi:hypothetical protein
MTYRNDFEMILDDVSSYEPIQSTLVEEMSGVMVAAAFDPAVLTAITSTNEDNQHKNDHFVAILFDMNVLQKDLMIDDDDGATVSFEMSLLALLSTPPLDGREDEERERLAAVVVVSSFGVVNRWSLSMSCESRSILERGKIRDKNGEMNDDENDGVLPTSNGSTKGL